LLKRKSDSRIAHPPRERQTNLFQRMRNRKKGRKKERKKGGKEERKDELRRSYPERNILRVGVEKDIISDPANAKSDPNDAVYLGP
jgi:hypothetical protein